MIFRIVLSANCLYNSTVCGEGVSSGFYRHLADPGLLSLCFEEVNSCIVDWEKVSEKMLWVSFWESEPYESWLVPLF